MRDFFKENKRLLIWLVILAMILLTIKGAAAFSWSDDFEDGAITGWTKFAGTSASASATDKITGSYSLRLYDSSNSGSTHYYYNLSQNINDTNITFCVDLRPLNPGIYYQWIGLWNDTMSTSSFTDRGLAIVHYNDEFYYVNSAGAVVYVGDGVGDGDYPSAAGYYHVCFANINTDTFTTDIYINGSMVENNIFFNHNVTYFSSIEIGGMGTSQTGYAVYDNFNITYSEYENFTVTAIDAWNSSTILSFNVTINGTQYNTTTGVIQTTIPYDASSLFDILFTADGYNDRTYEDYNVSSNLQAELYPFNSLEVYAINLSSGSNVTNFTTLLYNEDGSYQNITTSSLARFSDLDAGTYTARISSDGFNNAFYTLTVSDDSYQTLIAYLNEEVNEVIFQSQDEFTGNNVEGVTVSQFAFVNSSLTLIQAKYSDISGRVSFFHDGSSQYKFRFEKDGYTTREFFLAPEFDSYIVKITPSSPVTNETLIDDVVITVENYLFYNNLTNWFNFTIVSPSGALSSYSVNITTPNNSSLTSGSNAYGELVSASVFEDTAVFGDAAKVTICYLSSFYSEEVCRSYVYPYKSWLTSAGGLQGIIDSTSGMGRLEKALVATFFTLVFAGFMAALGSAIGAGGVMAAIGVIGGMGFFWQIEFINKYVFFMIALIGVMYVLSRTGAD